MSFVLRSRSSSAVGAPDPPPLPDFSASAVIAPVRLLGQNGLDEALGPLNFLLPQSLLRGHRHRLRLRR